MSTHWEAERRWEIVRYLVYYLVEDLVDPQWIPQKDVVDFSCGLGDMSAYLWSHGPRSLTATSPDSIDRPKYLKDKPEIVFLPQVSGSQIQENFSPESIDLFAARMVFQFPTMEDHHIDVDAMLRQIYPLLRPGGRIVICSHEYTELEDDPRLWNLDKNNYFAKVKEMATGSRQQKVEGLIELIETIGIPPREGVHGQTGFGLKALMCVDSFVQAGFQIERCEEIEDFTFPIGLREALQQNQKMKVFASLAPQVFSIKKEIINSKAYQDKYARPQLRQTILRRLLQLHEFVTMPVFSVVARKPSQSKGR